MTGTASEVRTNDATGGGTSGDAPGADKTTQQPRESVAELRRRGKTGVLIIGGGINGIATFRDLALQGIDVTIVDRGDWASGASSASSHMIHGGVRYLENGELRLVRESVIERNRLVRIAPHYVKPLETTIPIFRTVSGLFSAPLRLLTHRHGKPKERGALLIKVGLEIYDAFSRAGGSTVPRHRFHGRRVSLRELPRLNPSVRYTATYYDASMHDPERLALDVLRDGVAAGGHAVNYAEAVGSDAEGVRLRDVVSGEEFHLAADVVVNASGPWTDLTNDALGLDTKYMGGTKGSHIVLDHPELLAATAGREIFFENDDGRIVLIYPLKGKVMIGTTDIDADVTKPIVCTEDEVDYFFDLVGHVFPDITLDRSQIVYRFSGVRPLPRHDDLQPGFVSRDYRIVPGELHGTPLLSLVGGKWTTFRALGEQLGDAVLERLGAKRTNSTGERPIGGGRGFPASDAEQANWAVRHPQLPRRRTLVLLNRYGTRAVDVIEALAGAPETPLADAPEYSREEIAYLVRAEQVVTLLDIVKRRTSLAFKGRVTDGLLDELAEIAAGELGWSAQEREARREEAVRILVEHHGLHLHAKTAA